jgi:hypothetical protein
MNAQTKIETATGLALLRVPFPENQISKLPKETRAQIDQRKNSRDAMVFNCAVCGGHHHKNAVHLDYVGHAAATDRLLDADPRWTWDPVPDPASLGLPTAPGGMWIKLTVDGVSRYGFGSADGKTGGDAIKEIIGDAIRNAGMRFGMALDLWHKGDLHADEGVSESTEKPNAQSEQGMPDAEWAKLAGLLKATGVPASKLIEQYKVENLRLLNQQQYGNAIERLTKTLAEKTKRETDAKAEQEAGFGEILDDDIPF